MVELRRARNAFIVQAPLRVNFAIQISDCKRGGFCKRKAPKQTTDSHNPEKPPSGRFFCCRTIKPSERKTAQRLFRRSAAGDSEAPLLPPQGTAPFSGRLSLRPIRGGMMPRPIRVSVVYKTQFPTSRHRACEITFLPTCSQASLSCTTGERAVKSNRKSALYEK